MNISKLPAVVVCAKSLFYQGQQSNMFLNLVTGVCEPNWKGNVNEIRSI